MKVNKEIQEELADMDSPIAGLSNALPYEVPDGYFRQLAKTLTEDVLAMEGQESSLDIPAHMPYEATEEYFEALPHTLLQAVKAADNKERQPKVVSFITPWKKVTQWAAAAVLVIGIGIGGYRYMHPATPETRLSKQLSAVDADALHEYAMHHADEFDDETLEATVAGNTSLNSTIANLNDEEIRDYLDETGWTDKETLN